MHMLIAHAAHSPSKHHWLVVTAHRLISIRLILKGTKVTIDCRTAKLIIKAGCTDGTFKHNIQSRDHMFWLTCV